MLKIESPILNFFLLILVILPNPIPDSIDKWPGVSLAFLEKDFELNLEQKSLDS